MNQKVLGEFLNLKTSRAVDRIFTENKLDSIHSIFGSVQENKKANTHNLRQALQKNYEKMLYCSDLMDSIKEFGESINKIADKIEGQIESKKNDKNRWSQKDTIGLIETKMRSKEFRQAMEICTNPPETVSYEDEYYLQYLKVEVLKNLEKHLIHNNLQHRIIEQAYICIKSFITKTQKEDICSMCEDYGSQSLLGIIREHIAQNNEVLQIIFKFKLSLLRRCGDKQKLSAYFKDLSLLLDRQENENTLNYRKIFVQNINTVKQHLTEIFVYKQDDGLVKFKRELYDSLLQCKQFEEILSNFHIQISKDNPENIDNPMLYLHELWNNYIVNLVDYLVQEVNPIRLINKLQYNELLNIPKQLLLFAYDNSIDMSIELLKLYEGKLSLFTKNIISTIERCSRQEKQKIRDRFMGKVDKLKEECVEEVRHLQQQRTKLAFRKFILLTISCEQFTRKVSQIQLLSENSISEWKSSKMSPFWSIFIIELNLSQSMIEFDQFFVGYIEQLKKKEEKIKVVKYIIQWITSTLLSQLMSTTEGKGLQNIKHTLGSLRDKREKITIRQKILLPYIAEYIFNSEIKKISMPKNIYHKHFQSYQNSVQVVEDVYEGEDDFQIGEKESSQEVFKIGKSIMGIGSNFIYGFMPKKK